MHTVATEDGESPAAGDAEQIVEATFYPADKWTSKQSIKIIDFGECFSDDDPPVTLATPNTERAPEIIFGDKFDHRVGMWAMGCLVGLESRYRATINNDSYLSLSSGA